MAIEPAPVDNASLTKYKKEARTLLFYLAADTVDALLASGGVPFTKMIAVPPQEVQNG